MKSIHFICKHGDNFKKIGDQLFESGEWSCSDVTANEAIGSNFYLHEKQNARAWHGGRIVEWRHASAKGRKIFTYQVENDFRILCPGNWSQECAIVKD